MFGAASVALCSIALTAMFPAMRLPLWLAATSPVALYAVFLQVRDPVMDYRAYSAMIGPFLLLPLLPIAALYALVFAWAWRSFRRTYEWRNPLSLWAAAARDDGGPVAWLNLGSAHQMRREFGRAKECYAKCLELHSETGVVLLNLGLIEGMEGRPVEARDKIEECVRLHPRYRAAWIMLRQVYEFLKDAPNVERCRLQVEALK